MELKKTGKRIVSKGEYVGRWNTKAGEYSVGIILLMFCLAMSLLVCYLLKSTNYMIYHPDTNSIVNTDVTNYIATDVLFAISVVIAAFFSGYSGWLKIKEAKQIDTGIPLTRENATDLPAEETLVRASRNPFLSSRPFCCVRPVRDRRRPPRN